MATDWPGHAATNRHPHKPVNCACWQFFSANNEPAWVYLWDAIGPQSNTNLEYLNRAHYLTPDRTSNACRWKYSDLGQDLEFTREIFLEIKPGQAQAFYYMEWRIKVYSLFINVEYEQASSNIIAAGDRWTRGTSFTSADGAWGRIEDSPIPDWGPPIGYGVLTPLDCLPGWEVGDPIPSPPET